MYCLYRTKQDHRTLLCRGTNAMGRSVEPCSIQVVEPGRFRYSSFNLSIFTCIHGGITDYNLLYLHDASCNRFFRRVTSLNSFSAFVRFLHGNVGFDRITTIQL